MSCTVLRRAGEIFSSVANGKNRKRPSEVNVAVGLQRVRVKKVP